MEIITMEIDLLMQILAGLIVASIIGAATSMFIFYRCLHSQAQNIGLMKKATAFVLRRMVQETKTLHPEEKDEIEDLEKTYRDLTENDSK